MSRYDKIIDALVAFASTTRALVDDVEVAQDLRDVDPSGAADYLLAAVHADISTALPDDLVTTLKDFEDDDYLGPEITMILETRPALAA